MRHIGHLGPTQLAQTLHRFLHDVTAIDPNFAAGDFDPTAAIGHGSQTNSGLAGTAFADQTQHLAFGQIKADTMHDFNRMRLFAGRIDRRADLQIADFQKAIVAHPRPPFRLVVRFSTQSATRFTEIASVAMAIAGTRAALIP